MNRYGVNGKLLAVPGKGDELLGYLLEAARAMAEVDTCLCYIVGKNESEPDAVYVYEVWESAEAHQASLSLAAVTTLIGKARPVIAGIEDFPDLVIYGGKANLA